ncbi:hypothetical protein [Dyadobacter sp. SG02]|uniref:hypothetical protein n=1 Tax=Dyadobacter sp. SG02 TaxID=1855291 RepID=UPI0015A67A51|nr:hypothetical protein [Dyadobacter sp. SG02]
MGSIIQKIADEIRLHGSWEAYLEWREQHAQSDYDSHPNPLPVSDFLPDPDGDIAL